MKKLFALLVVAGMVAVVACGPSAEEKRAKQVADSIAMADSLAKAAAATADTTAKVDTTKVDTAVKAK
jgi:hypothetical protein